MRILSITLLIALTACSNGSRRYDNQLAKVNIIDRNGFSETFTSPDRLKQYENVNFLSPQPYQKVLRVYQPKRDGSTCSHITSYYPNGIVSQYLEVSNGRAFGAYREWHENGVQKIQARVIGGEADLGHPADSTWLFEGISYAWDEEGHLIAEVAYQDGYLHGSSLYYHENGCLWKDIPFVKGSREGESRIYLENGQLFQTSMWKNDERNGSTKRFWDCDRIASDEEYICGKLVSGQYFDRFGKLISSIANGKGYKAVFGKDTVAELHEYIGGQAEGEVRVYASNGSLIRRYSVLNDEKHGEEIIYYTDGPHQQQRLSLQWYEGKIQGLSRTWYRNGTLESQREMSDNKKNGILSSWYQNGRLQMVEEYENDRLIKGEYYKMDDRTPISEVMNGKGTATIYDAIGKFIRKVTYENGKPTS